MNKISHIKITKRLSTNLSAAGKFWLLLGSITPDLLVHTYYVGHTWDATIEKTCKKLYNLEQWGAMNWRSYLKLGYALHYIEDYFTYPHNNIYDGTLAQHCVYEVDFCSYIRALDDNLPENDIDITSAKKLCDWIEKTHNEYLNSDVHGFSSDYNYITKVSQVVADTMLNAFETNEGRRIDTLGALPVVVQRL